MKFYKLSFEDLCRIFSCNELKISSELQLFNAAVDQINFNNSERSKHMKTFLKLIRLPLLINEILINVIKIHNICKKITKCQNLVKKAIKMKNEHARNTFNLKFQNRFHSCEFETKRFMFVSSKNCHNLLKTSSEFIFVRNKFEKVRTTNKMLKQRNYCKTAAIE